MSYRGLSQLPVCSTPYFGPYLMESGSPCLYKMSSGQCCDPTETIFGSDPPVVPPGSVNMNYGTVQPTRTCRTPFYSSKYGDFNLYTDIQGFCDPTLTDTTAPGLGLMNTGMVIAIMGGLAVLVIAGSGGGGGTKRRR